jgi:protein-disulfide isomerase
MPEEKNNVSLPVAIIAAGLIIAAAIFFTRTSSPSNNGAVDNQNAKNNAQPTADNGSNPGPIASQDHVLGDPNAPVTVLVYSDLECPFCRRFHSETIKPMMDEYGKLGKVKLVYRHFPLPATMHPNALNYALTSECVTDMLGQGQFWQFVDKLFSTNAASLDDAKKVAESLGADKTKLEDCINSQKFLSVIQKDQADGQNAGVRGTPSSFIIKGDKVTPIDGGAIPYTELKPLIERNLNG